MRACLCVCVSVCVCERERERERECTGNCRSVVRQVSSDVCECVCVCTRARAAVTKGLHGMYQAIHIYFVIYVYMCICIHVCERQRERENVAATLQLRCVTAGVKRDGRSNVAVADGNPSNIALIEP